MTVLQKTKIFRAISCFRGFVSTKNHKNKTKNPPISPPLPKLFWLLSVIVLACKRYTSYLSAR